MKPWGSSISRMFHQHFADLSWIAPTKHTKLPDRKSQAFSVITPWGQGVLPSFQAEIHHANVKNLGQKPSISLTNLTSPPKKLERQLMLQDPPFFSKKHVKQNYIAKKTPTPSQHFSELGIQIMMTPSNQDSRKTYKTSDLKDVIGSNVSLARSLKMSKSAWPSSHVSITMYVCIHQLTLHVKNKHRKGWSVLSFWDTHTHTIFDINKKRCGKRWYD